MQMLLETNGPVWAIGLMSGTSLDGIDAALIKTDGERIEAYGDWLTLPTPELRERLSRAVRGEGDILRLERDITLLHNDAVQQLLQKAGMQADEVALIGFHGQTVAHRPEAGLTWQLGNGALLAELTGINVINDFRRRDMAAGGQGAPLVPLFHAAIAGDEPKPVAILNIGGVANITYLDGRNIVAFDVAPGNALMNDWIETHLGKPFDENGMLASYGTADAERVAAFLAHDFFAAPPPKSLDRQTFTLEVVYGMSAEDGMATLLACTVEGIKAAFRHFPTTPKRVLVAGGGRHNRALMQALAAALAPEVVNIDELGFAGDALEAQAFGYLAVRAAKGLPLTLPSTTGVNRAVTGGAFYPA